MSSDLILNELHDMKQQISALTAKIQTVMPARGEKRSFSPLSQRVVTSFKPMVAAPVREEIRDMSPISDDEQGIYDRYDETAADELDRPSQKKVNEKAENVFRSIPAQVRKQLPVVSRNILYKLLSEKQFVNLAELLPRNRTPAGPKQRKNRLCKRGRSAFYPKRGKTGCDT